jgi:hypothetical protein
MTCPKEIIFKGLNILSEEETLDEIIKKNKSISRFGDGEFNLIFGEEIGFQKVNKTLIKKLREVLKKKRRSLLIGINIPYNNCYLNKYAYKTKIYFIIG